MAAYQKPERWLLQSAASWQLLQASLRISEPEAAAFLGEEFRQIAVLFCHCPQTVGPIRKLNSISIKANHPL